MTDVIRSFSSNKNTSHIERLPNELLVEVFHVYDARMDASYNLWQNERRRYRRHWLPLMLVCRHWRALGVSAPSLWQLIELGINQKWAELALARSGSLPIRLLLTDKFPRDSKSSLSFLVPHANRIQKFFYPLASSRKLLQSLQCILHAAMPVLDELEILVPNHSAQVPPHGLPELEIARFPMLRILRLSSVPIHLEADVFCKLHSLSLDGPVFRDLSVGYSDVLSVLQRCSDLKELRLHHLLSRLPNRTFPDHAINLNLPKLQRLVIWDIPSLTSLFLGGIHLSPEATLRVCHPLQTRLSRHAGMVDAFPSLLPADRSGLPILRSVNSASIDCWQDFDIALKGFAQVAKVTLKIRGSAYADGSFYLDNALRDFRVLFAGAPIKRLDISGDLDTVPSIEDYLSFLDGFPTLQTIEVRGHGSPLTFLLALARPSPFIPSVSERSDADSDEHSSEHIVCPGLRFLTMEYVDWQQGLIEALVTVLRRRMDHGLPKLEELMLTLSLLQSERPEADDEQLEDTLALYEKEFEALTCKFLCGPAY